MFQASLSSAAALLLSFSGVASALSSCPTAVATKVPAPSVAPGIEARLVSSSLTAPRGIQFDSEGTLLVVDRGEGIKALTLQDDGGTCVTVASSKLVVDNADLNHGIAFLTKNILLASTSDAVIGWGYDPATSSITTDAKMLITGMDNADHATRTITVSSKKPGTVVINRGSQSNIDPEAAIKSSGHAQVKAFDLTRLGDVSQPFNPYDFTRDGTLMAWGVRNDVGVAEHPTTGGIWAVENSVDDITRNGDRFSDQNPGEKLNYFGTLVKNTSPNQGSNFGYPYCYAAFRPAKVPNPPPGLVVGQQFTINPQAITDAQCKTTKTAPRLVFDAHMAPLDIKFSANGRAAFVTFHGSFDRPVPQGYKLSTVFFNANGQPTANSTSQTAVVDLVKNHDTSSCPTNCFRPVAIGFDHQGKLYFSSDATGEIYVAKISL